MHFFERVAPKILGAMLILISAVAAMAPAPRQQQGGAEPGTIQPHVIGSNRTSTPIDPDPELPQEPAEGEDEASQETDPDPIDYSTGAFSMDEHDLRIPGIGGLEFLVDRYHYTAATWDGPFGRRWDSPLFRRMSETYAGSPVHFYNGRLRDYVFTWSQTSGGVMDYTTPPGLFFKLRRFTNGTTVTFELSDANGIVQRFEHGETKLGTLWYRLKETVNRNGVQMSFHYDAVSRLASITDTQGRANTFTYYQTGANADRIKKITDAAGAAVSYVYDAQGRLEQVIRPPTAAFTRSAFEYTYDAQDRLLSVKEPGESAPYLVNGYDGFGRLITQQLGDASQVTTLTWSHPWVTVVNRAGDTIHYLTDPYSHRIIQRIIVESANPGVTYVTNYDYDTNFLVSRTTQPNGQIVDKVYDLQNPDPRARGNLLSLTRRASIADPTPEVETWTYEPTYNLIATHTSARQNALNGGVYVAASATRYVYDANGNCSSVTFPDVVSSSGTQVISIAFTYDSLGRMTRQTDPNGCETHYVYDTVTLRPDPKTEIHDPQGANQVIAYEYDAANRLTRRTDTCACSGAAKIDWTYSSRGEVLTQIVHVDAQKTRTTNFAYDAMSNLVSSATEDDSPTGDGWFTTTYTYDLLHLPLSVTEDVDAVTTRTTSFSYDAKGRLVGVNYPEGLAVEYVYDARDLLRQVKGLGLLAISTDDAIETRTYDVNGRLQSVIDALGNTTSYAWDGYDRLASETDALGTVAAFQWDADGNPLNELVVDSFGQVLESILYTIDFHNRMTKIETMNSDEQGLPIGDGWHTISQAFDSMSNLVEIIYENGARKTYSYDLLSRIIAERDSLAMSNGFDYEYWQDGSLKKLYIVEGLSDGTAQSTRLVAEVASYDYEGRPLEIRDAMGRATQLTWTLNGQLKSRKDRRNSVIDLEHDELGRTRKHIRRITAGGAPASGDIVTRVLLDGLDRKTALTQENQPNGSDQTTNYAYDAHGRLAGVTSPDGTATTYQYDLGGNLTTRVDPNGSIVTSSFDALNRRTGWQVNRGPGVGGMTFVSLGLDRLGRILTATNDDYVVSRSWTTNGQLLSETTTPSNGGVALTAKARFDAMGWLQRVHYPADTTSTADRVVYDRDPTGRLLGVTKQEGSTTRTVAAFAYHGSRLIAHGGPNRSSTIGYDTLGNPNLIAHSSTGTNVARFDILRDEETDVSSIYRTFYGPTGVPLATGIYDGGSHYVYDGADRLTTSYNGLSAADYAAGNWAGSAKVTRSYGLDRAWNRTSVTTAQPGRPTALQNYVTNIVNEYLQVGFQQATYDFNGNRKTVGTGNAWTFDYANRPVAITSGAITTTMNYDAFGRRVESVFGGTQTTERLTYWGWSPIESRETSGATTTVREFVYGSSCDNVLEMRDVGANQRYNYFLDPSGSPVVVTNGVGSTVETYRYDDFGVRYLADPSNGSIIGAQASPIGSPVSFQARWTLGGDPKKLDFRARIYLPEWGRFAQPDPKRYPGGRLNRYHFAHHNPNHKDPFGKNEDGKMSDGPGDYTHVGETRLSSRLAKLDDQDEEDVAQANWDQDNTSRVAGLGDHDNKKYHALGSEKTRRKYMRKLFAKMFSSCSRTHLGRALHFVQDYVYHRDPDGKPYNAFEGHGLESAMSWIGLAYDPDNPTGRLKEERHFQSVLASFIVIKFWQWNCGTADKRGFPDKYSGGKPKPKAPTTPGKPKGPSTGGPQGDPPKKPDGKKPTTGTWKGPSTPDKKGPGSTPTGKPSTPQGPPPHTGPTPPRTGFDWPTTPTSEPKKPKKPEDKPKPKGPSTNGGLPNSEKSKPLSGRDSE